MASFAFNKSFKFTIVLLCLIQIPVNSTDTEIIEKDSSKILSRRRRYLTFPEGASFSVSQFAFNSRKLNEFRIDTINRAIFQMATCMTVGVLGQPMPGIFTWGLNWGIAYELPNQTASIDAFKRLRKLPQPLVARRYRRDLYSKLELIMNE